MGPGTHGSTWIYLIPVGASNWVLLMGSPTKVLIVVWFWFLNLLWVDPRFVGQQRRFVVIDAY
jgi:hypothetical protein